MPGGQISHTGVGGLTLGGGLGWLMRHHGLTIDSLIGAEVVLADGEIVHACRCEHPDLFWALRGGGGDFGVVTRFEFQAHRVGPLVLGGMLVFPWERAREAFQATRALMAGAPDALTAFAVLVTAPPEAPFPAEVQGRPVAVVAVAWSGDLDEGERVLAPLRAAAPLVDLIAPMPYVALQSMLDQTAPTACSYYDKLHYLPEVSDAVHRHAARRASSRRRRPSPRDDRRGWAARSTASRRRHRVRPPRRARVHLADRLLGRRSRSSPRPSGCGARSSATAPFASGGVYVNALDLGRSVREAYTDDVWERLVEVKRRYDPDGVFNAHGIRA